MFLLALVLPSGKQGKKGGEERRASKVQVIKQRLTNSSRHNKREGEREREKVVAFFFSFRCVCVCVD